MGAPESSVSLENALDAALAKVVAEGFDGPPVPVEPAGEPETGVPPDAPVAAQPDPPEDEPEGETLPAGQAARAVNIGLLADLAVGRMSPAQAAQATGLTQAQLQSDLALALKEVDPKEIARAMGLQAAEQQLTSGAIYGVVLADLVGDMLAGRLKSEHKLDLAKLLAKVGRIEPKDEKGAALGSGFQLNIVFGGEPKPVVIEATQPAVEESA